MAPKHTGTDYSTQTLQGNLSSLHEPSPSRGRIHSLALLKASIASNHFTAEWSRALLIRSHYPSPGMLTHPFCWSLGTGSAKSQEKDSVAENTLWPWVLKRTLSKDGWYREALEFQWPS